MKRLVYSLLAVTLLLGCRSPKPSAGPKVPPQPYVRLVRETNLVSLDVAIRSFARKPSEPTIVLCAVTHLGESNYFSQIQRLLAPRSVVLFEGIGSPPPPAQSHPSQISTRSQPNSEVEASLQARMARSMGLVFQLNSIRYDQPNFRHCDLSVAELRDLLTSKPTQDKAGGSQSFENLIEAMQGRSDFEAAINFALRLVESSPGMQGLTRLAMIQMLASIDADPANVRGLPPDMKELMAVLVQRRNDKVMDEVTSLITKQRRGESLAVLYGAGHMPDLEDRLQSIGYRPATNTWLTAISVNLSKSGIVQSQADFLQQLFQSFSPSGKQ